MNPNNYCVIMAGGIGARFWPMSKTSHPKQFIDFLGTGETLIQRTFKRFTKICRPENIYIVTNEIYRDLVMNQLPEITGNQVLCEPMRRNTAPCIAYASYKILKRNKNANIVVAPSDHIILKEDNFTEVIVAGLNTTANNNCLLTLGIKPSRPDTGYGYIQYDDCSGLTNDNRVSKVITFTEKPQLELAISFLQSGDFLWNSGIFIWNLPTILEALRSHLPEVNAIFADGIDSYDTPAEQDFIMRAYAGVKNISIDYGVMEKASNVYVLAADFGWSDLGTWGSLYDIRPKDENNNTIVGDNVMPYDMHNCIVHMPKDKLVVLQGLENYIVVEDDNILLVCRRQDEQEIRNFVNDVKVYKGEKFI
ncbi:MAG TPA: sugar phosphate nucleotidyltransferase [Bacteroidales bacterium]|nr:sugar phosphate nucleotidyltransferase [Bacteroidales bacterium]